MSTAPALRIESIEQIHRLLGRPPPAHPHVSVIAASWQEPLRLPTPVAAHPVESALYVVSLKRGDECDTAFGRQGHDGQAGSVLFASPGQTVTPLGGGGGRPADGDGWTVVFHPALLDGSPLAALMPRYRFFAYATREALHLTEEERERLTGLVHRLEHEASVPPGPFTADVLTAQLQLLLAYCQRAHARQFEVRARAGGVAARLDLHLTAHLASAGRPGHALPTVASCARALGYSPDYLSDLLRAETGTGAREHVHQAVVEAAKARLLASDASVSEVAFALGFEHPQHFARLFRQKTGQSPGAWRRAAGR